METQENGRPVTKQELYSCLTVVHTFLFLVLFCVVTAEKWTASELVLLWLIAGSILYFSYLTFKERKMARTKTSP
jgi:hypothetical protein